MSSSSAAPAVASDQFGRSIEYLRISVTDRCNFRCVYCMPEEGMQWLPKNEILSYEEIAGVVAQLAPLGLRRLRITGGEPTIRPQIHELVRLLRRIPEITDIALSTNGVRLPEIGGLLREAGLDRVNMSVDSLRRDRIVQISRRNLDFDPVRSALAAEAAGLDPIKLNMVVMRGVNDDEVVDLARLTIDHPWHVRFIELMPVGGLRELTWQHVVPSDEILARLERVSSLERTAGPARGNGPAEYYTWDGAAGTIGVITPMSHTYCASCNRVRLTATGQLRTCLFGDHEVDLRTPLRAGEPLEPFFRRALAEKPKEHALLQMQVGGLKALSQVGG
ncbi:MAG TPA: GTP 3',8-cyclase MoaA [Gemmatimonadaceae bacterium]|jgi:cyclic pyranopterin phosphate synthase|nr:GTP 3',8-cyclase MoaA [Gemmatimonadaceae bacterium]